MSYILNALRKSEKERLAQQPDNVIDRILVDQPQQRQRPGKLILAIVLSNLLVAACLFWFMHTESKSNVPAVATNSNAVVDNSQAMSELSAPANSNVNQEISDNKIRPVLPSIEELVASKKPPITEVSDNKNKLEKKPANNRLKSDSIKNTQVLPEKSTEMNPALQANMAKLNEVEIPKYVEEMTEKKPLVSAEQNSIPLLYELPSEFRHTLPDLNINVFVYSEQAEERFVMIDMMKYKVGQRIKDAVLIKQIKPDSLILEYNNQTFQIKRP
jgi:general secretion pathway protein B